MKRILISALVLLAFSFFATANDDEKIDFTKTPTTLQNFVNTHFSGVELRYVEVDEDGYEVKFRNGTELQFDLNGEWKEIDVNRNIVPESIFGLLPAKIPVYLKENYPQRRVETITKKYYGFKIELAGNPDTDLMFDTDGNFRGLDD